MQTETGRLVTDGGNLVAEVHSRLEAAGDPERQAVAVTYFPTVMRVFGTPMPDVRIVVRDVNKRLKAAPPKEVLALCQRLVDDRIFEGRLAAYELLWRHKATFAILAAMAIELLGKGNDNWATVDAFSTQVSGPAWRTGQVTDAAVDRWADSDDRWWRRTAVVSTVPLNLKSRGGTGDTPRTLHVCGLVVADHDDMVVKGLSWALRELAKSDPEAVEGFLDAHEADLAARVRREVRNKLDTGLKTPKRG